MSKEPLTVTKEAVLSAAKTCPEAEKVLKALFPTAFKSDFHKCAVGQKFRVYKNNKTSFYEAVLVQYGPGQYNLIDTKDWNRLFDNLGIEMVINAASSCLVPMTYKGSCGTYFIEKVK